MENPRARGAGPQQLQDRQRQRGTLPSQQRNYWVNNTIRMGVPLLPVFRSVAHSNGQIELTWTTTPWQQVQVQYTSDLTSATWTNLGSSMASVDGTLSASDTPGPDRQRFYRVILLP